MSADIVIQLKQVRSDGMAMPPHLHFMMTCQRFVGLPMDYRNPREGKSMHARIVHDLGIEIVSGKLRAGDRLPPEAALLETYGVSRPVLREASRVLVAKGLVMSKPRLGTVVRPRSDWHMLDPDVLDWTLKTMPEDDFFRSVLAVRRIIEPAAAALAATQATTEDIADIAAAFEKMEAAQTPEAMHEPDLAFHRSIMAATHNDLLAYIGNMMSLALSESIRVTNTHPDVHALSLPRHKAILTAIASRDQLGARQASLVQLENAGDHADNLLALRDLTQV